VPLIQPRFLDDFVDWNFLKFPHVYNDGKTFQPGRKGNQIFTLGTLDIKKPGILNRHFILAANIHHLLTRECTKLVAQNSKLFDKKTSPIFDKYVPIKTAISHAVLQASQKFSANGSHDKTDITAITKLRENLLYIKDDNDACKVLAKHLQRKVYSAWFFSSTKTLVNENSFDTILLKTLLSYPTFKRQIANLSFEPNFTNQVQREMVKGKVLKGLQDREVKQKYQFIGCCSRG